MFPGANRCLISFEHGLAFKAFHGFFGSEDGLAEGMVFPKILGEDFVDEVVRIVLIHLDLFEDHAAFAGDVLGIKYGI